MIKKYNIDGIRIDTVPEVPKWFWKQFADAAGVYQVGEVFDGRLDYVSDYQKCCLDGVLNYPLFFAMRDAFTYNRSMNTLESAINNINKFFSDPSALGVFVNNHDNWRFLNKNSNTSRFKNAIAFSLLTSKNLFLNLDGIPIVYYGDEQLFSGGDDPQNREPLFARLDRNSDMYKFIKTIVNLRKSQNLWSKPQIQRYSDDNFYAFTRDNILALFTNTDNDIYRTITYHSYPENTKLCNIFDKNGDCIYVRNGKIDIRLGSGFMKAYIVSN
jgi:alpha-amylase